MSWTHDPTRLDYVDGLRALAVGLVLWFHAQLPWIPNGYLGVDIFFVISGFLITAQIFDGAKAGSFSILDFYARRILRIWPPLFVVIAAVVVASSVMPILPVDTRRIAISAIASTAMVSNWYFLQQNSDYFAPTAEREPLLHIWSLGVEEQYYLVAPAFVIGLAVLARRRGINLYVFGLVCAAALLVCSLVAALAFAVAQPQLVFYGTPLRVWEFAAGACAILSIRCGLILPVVLARIGMWIGLLAIVAACVLSPSGAMARFLLEVLVVAGAGLVVVCGGFAQGGLIKRFLSLGVMVWLGLLSYSLYLWHWPVLSFWRIIHLDPVSTTANVTAGIAVPLALAFVTYLAVERPIRAWRLRGRLAMPRGRIIARAVALLLMVGAIGLAEMLWSVRLSGSERYRAYAEATVNLMEGCRMGARDGGPLDRCRLGPPATARAMLWGDSHARSLSAAVAASAQEAGLGAHLQWDGGCPPLLRTNLYVQGAFWAACVRRNETILRWLGGAELHDVTGVVLMARWQGSVSYVNGPGSNPDTFAKFTESASRTLAELRALGLRVLVLGPVPEMPYPVPECIYRTNADREGGRCGASRQNVDAGLGELVTAFRSVVNGFDNARFIDLRSALCDDEYCWPGRGGQIYYSDAHHLSDVGARVVRERFKADFAWVFAAHQRFRPEGH